MAMIDVVSDTGKDNLTCLIRYISRKIKNEQFIDVNHELNIDTGSDCV